MSASLILAPDRPWLAPLAGYSDLPFRLLCRKYGCAVTVTEMVSAKGLRYGSPGTRDLLLTNPADAPLVVQLFGAEEEFLVPAIEELRSMGFRYFDLNCGCSVRKVVKTGSGAALLREPDHLLALGQALVKVAEPGCMGFKLRLGWRAENPTFQCIGQGLEQAGAGWLALHPRFATQGFSGQADWSQIRVLQEKVSIGVVASGDLLCAEDGLRCLQETGARSLMFARGALSDPGIFSSFSALRAGKTSTERSWEAFVGMTQELCALYRKHDLEQQGLLKMRTLAPRFFKHLAGAKFIRKNLVQCRNWEDVFVCLEEAQALFSEKSSTFKRFDQDFSGELL